MRFVIFLSVLMALPALAQPRGPAARASELDALFAGLKAAPSEETAVRIERRLREVWTLGVSPAALLLLNRSSRELASSAHEAALEDVEAALVIDPEAPEGYHRRALARAALGDFGGALVDLQETLRREPRYFPAWLSLSRLSENRDDAKGALAAWEKVLELHPKIPNGDERLQVLRRKALGDDI